jgi:hypothetical protein
VAKVDPAAGPLEVRLPVFERKGVGPKTTLKGRVVDGTGKPVVGAKIEPEGVERGSGTSWGGLDGIDPLAVTDENGGFLITSKEPFDGLNVVVEARGLAPLRKNGLAPDREHVITLTEGASVMGRVLWKGKPLEGVSIGMAGANRLAGEFVGSFEMGTGQDGRFLIPALPPETEYYLYGLINSLQDYGAIPARTVRTRKDGTVTDVGDLAVAPALRIAGRLQLSDGASLPPHTRVTIGFEQAWDAQYAEVDPSGRFDLRGIPPHSQVSLSTRVKGYRLSGKNASLDPWNPFSLNGRLDQDKTNLVVLLEPGKDLEPNHDLSPDEHPKNQPLRGAEAPADLSDHQVASGRVVDAETQQPVSLFQITPGRESSQPGREPMISWESTKVQSFTNGAYAMTFPQSPRTLRLMVEAEGYLPAASPPLTGGHASYDFQLKRGTGPAGVLLLPNGAPAAAVPVFLGTAREQFGLSADGRMMAFRNPQSEMMTDAEGRFRFAPRLENGRIFAASEEGYAECATEDLAKNPKITLQPWGRIEGTLLRSGTPVTNETLAVTSASPYVPNQPRVSFQHRAVTDADGKFQFDHVPPGAIQVSTLVPLSGEGMRSAWTYQPQATTTVPPGKTVTVQIEKKDAPAGRPGGLSPLRKPSTRQERR